jgi:propionate CoA-transferase
MLKLRTAAEAVKMIKDGDTVVTSGFMLATTPEELFIAIEDRFTETNAPKDLTLMCAAGVGDLRGGNTGLNHFAHDGLLKRVIVGHFGSNDQIVSMVNANKIEAYNWPQGIVSHVLRARGNGEKGLLSRVGLRTYMDPRVSGSRMNDVTKEELVQLVNLNGDDYLYYKAPKVDIAIIRGTTSDEHGNISFEDEIALSMARVAALAAKASGGKVIAQVKNYVKAGQIEPKSVGVCGIFVDAVVLTKDVDRNHRMTPGALYDQAIAGHMQVPTGSMKPLEMSERKVIGRRAAMELVPNSIVNLGIGIPEAVSAVAAEEGCSGDMVMTVEAGAIGGVPAGGLNFGASLNPWSITDEPTQFDFYHSGYLDVTFLGLAEVNPIGDVNVSKFGPKIPGCGGFIDISQSTKKVVYCGTFTAGGLKVEITDGKVVIAEEGRSKKFKKSIEQITFSGKQALENGQEVIYITERAVLALTETGLELREIAPGIDLEKHILSQMEFEPAIAKDVKIMDKSLFMEGLIGLKGVIEAKRNH